MEEKVLMSNFAELYKDVIAPIGVATKVKMFMKLPLSIRQKIAKERRLKEDLNENIDEILLIGMFTYLTEGSGDRQETIIHELRTKKKT